MHLKSTVVAIAAALCTASALSPPPPQPDISAAVPCRIDIRGLAYGDKVYLRKTPCNRDSDRILTRLRHGDKVVAVYNKDSREYGCDFWYNKVIYTEDCDGMGYCAVRMEGWVHEDAIRCN